MMPDYIEDWRLRDWAAAILAAVFILVCLWAVVVTLAVFG